MKLVSKQEWTIEYIASALESLEHYHRQSILLHFIAIAADSLLLLSMK